MNLSELMTRDVEVIQPNCTLREAACRMRDLDVGLMPICDGTRLIGMITDRDITIRGTADGVDPETTEVSEIMTPDVVYAFEDQTPEDAANLMSDNQIRRLMVLNRQKRLVGIISLGDLAVGADERMAGGALEGISEPSVPNAR